MASRGKIVIKIKDGNFEAEGIGFEGKKCQDKMAFLDRVGQVVSRKDKKDPHPEPGPHVNIYKS
jgi:hypothetical protein